MPEKSFAVVRNHEEQYSIWPAGQDIPSGWEAVGVEGTKEFCLSRIQELWTDMRPLSLRTATADA
ncbi:MbtH family NRPS accessory protein [Nonomuraea sp. NPDC049419]|uniref:MbtH family protein n=1 Tax=Nonomuraea sp. NPDC049419 TaxID=3155772 RepID=UPI00342065A7